MQYTNHTEWLSELVKFSEFSLTQSIWFHEAASFAWFEVLPVTTSLRIYENNNYCLKTVSKPVP